MINNFWMCEEVVPTSPPRVATRALPAKTHGHLFMRGFPRPQTSNWVRPGGVTTAGQNWRPRLCEAAVVAGPSKRSGKVALKRASEAAPETTVKGGRQQGSKAEWGAVERMPGETWVLRMESVQQHLATTL